MSVLRSQRTYPLTLTGDALNTGITGAWDWAGDPANSRAGGNGQDHSGLGHHWTAPGTSPTVVANIGGVTGLDGRDTSRGRTATSYYSAPSANLANVGQDFGTGDFSMWFRVRAPSVVPASVAAPPFTRNKETNGITDLLVVSMYGVPATGGWHPYAVIGTGTNALDWRDTDTTPVAAGGIVDIHIVRSGTTVKAYVNGALERTSTNGSTWAAGTGSGTGNLRGCWADTSDVVLIDEINWGRALSDAEVAAHAANPYSYYANSAPVNSVAVTTPADSSSVGVNFVITGTYAGGDVPTSIEASFNGSAYQTIDASPAGGTFSGTFTGATPATGTLTVRWSNQTGVTDTVTSLTVVSASIALTVPDTPATAAVPYRIFQRNGSNQASVRITGTYTGTPTSIQYRWAGGAWTTLVASPSGGAFDATVTLTGPGQGDLEVRFSNATTVTDSIVSVGVGDVYMVGGQSNNVGMANLAFVAPVAPAANPTWKACIFDKANQWRQNVETGVLPFDYRTGSAYPSVYTAQTVYGSYFGALATLAMASGVPVAFVPCAMGSTGIGAWQDSNPLFDTMEARAVLVGAHKGVIWWQGESDAEVGMSQSSYTTQLQAMMDAWWASKGTPFCLININDQGISGSGPIRAAILSVSGTHPHVLAYADMLGAWAGGVHYGSTTHVNEIASRVALALGYVVDVDAPVMTGFVTATAITTTTYTISGWGATDNIGVTGFEVSLNGGSTWTPIGLVTTYNVTGRTPGAADAVRVRAKDAAGNASTPLSATVTLNSSSSTGSLTAAEIADAVWDEPLSGATTARQILSGMADFLRSRGFL